MEKPKSKAQQKRERIAAQEVQMQSLQSQIDQILGGANKSAHRQERWSGADSCI